MNKKFVVPADLVKSCRHAKKELEDLAIKVIARENLVYLIPLSTEDKKELEELFLCARIFLGNAYINSCSIVLHQAEEENLPNVCDLIGGQSKLMMNHLDKIESIIEKYENSEEQSTENFSCFHQDVIEKTNNSLKMN